MAPVMFGALIGVTFAALSRLQPPLGAIVFWGVATFLLVRHAVIGWRRMRLPFALAADLHAASISLALVILAIMGQPFPDLSPTSWVFFAIGASVSPILVLIESRVHAAEWRAWGRYMEQKTVWDIVAARHIPDLRRTHP
jgi:hypothetical protein